MEEENELRAKVVTDFKSYFDEKFSSLKRDFKEEYAWEADKVRKKNRNKIIRLADASPKGWTTIQEYEKNDVADDSDDDKKIRRAEERARVRVEKSRSRKAAETPSNPHSTVDCFRSRFRRDWFRPMGERAYAGGEQPRTLAGPGYGREFHSGQPPRQSGLLLLWTAWPLRRRMRTRQPARFQIRGTGRLRPRNLQGRNQGRRCSTVTRK